MHRPDPIESKFKILAPPEEIASSVIVRPARDGTYQLVVSPPIIREMARVLRYDFNWSAERVDQFARRVVDVAGKGLVDPETTADAVAADPDDNRILECAMDGKADLIVTNDRHLLDLKGHAGIPIVASVDFRRTLGLR
jgi:predicted nucleic acid-binding protein